MVSLKAIKNFLDLQHIAVIGASRDTRKFGHLACKQLKLCGKTIYPVNPNSEFILEEKCYASVQDLPAEVEGAVIIVNKNLTIKIIEELALKKIHNIWIQTGCESKKAIETSVKNNICPVTGECIFMYLEPLAFPHRFHRFFKKIAGKYPT